MPDFRLTGGCHCGKVRYIITAPAVDTHHCHCSICRKLQGSIFATHSIFPRAALKLEGQANFSTYSSSPKIHRNFCKTCGCHVAIDLDEHPDLVAVTTGTIDDGAYPGHPESVYRHTFVTSKVPWYEITDQIPQKDGFL